MNHLVLSLLAAAAGIFLALQWLSDRSWRRLMTRLPYVRAGIRQRMREELCLDCKVGEPHACSFMDEDEYQELLSLGLVRG